MSWHVCVSVCLFVCLSFFLSVCLFWSGTKCLIIFVHHIYGHQSRTPDPRPDVPDNMTHHITHNHTTSPEVSHLSHRHHITHSHEPTHKCVINHSTKSHNVIPHHSTHHSCPSIPIHHHVTCNQHHSSETLSRHSLQTTIISHNQMHIPHWTHPDDETRRKM